MTNTKKVKPTLPGGFQDLGPAEMILKRKVIERIVKIYELYGYVPIETSLAQKTEVLFGDAQNGVEMDYWITRRASAAASNVSTLALAFDQTVPASRWLAANLDQVPKPFSSLATRLGLQGRKAAGWKVLCIYSA